MHDPVCKKIDLTVEHLVCSMFALVLIVLTLFGPYFLVLRLAPQQTFENHLLHVLFKKQKDNYNCNRNKINIINKKKKNTQYSLANSRSLLIAGF